ncbi:hypothetical protein CSA80_01065 [Candidatus Saccharibacteria bacterium]|nr:MAG: hypothetical protein CR973_02090 [Candidatus Saccharibacteria bacterium]PID99340.1 MAG: hypothetical protein CSA80_01065 [Candidatus Saccharibacteria bacterium]
MTLKTHFNHPDFADEQLNESIAAILEANQTGAMSSIAGDKAHINTAYFAYTSKLELFFVSLPSDTHSINITENNSVALSFWSESSTWSENLQGVQIFGTAEELGIGPKLVEGMKVFAARYPAVSAIIKNPGAFKDGVAVRMFRVQSERVKLLDEPRFGRRNYLDLTLQ